MPKATNGPTMARRKRVYVRDHGLCRYCGKQTIETPQGSARNRPWRRTLDHVVPVAQGGVNRSSNLVTACDPCNTFKAGRTPEQAGMPLLPIGTCRILVPNRLVFRL